MEKKLVFKIRLILKVINSMKIKFEIEYRGKVWVLLLCPRIVSNPIHIYKN